MAAKLDEAAIAQAVAAGFVLDRTEAVPALIGRHEDFLIVAGLAGTAKDIRTLTRIDVGTDTLGAYQNLNANGALTDALLRAPGGP